MKIEDKLRKLKPCFSKTDLMWLFWLASEGEERDEVDELLDIMINSELSKNYSKAIFLEPPKPDICYGEYHFGSVIYPGKPYCTFGLCENEWIKHVLITGMSGVGKTNLAFKLLIELAHKKKPFLVFDWKKNYRDLKQLTEFRDMKVYTVGRDVKPFKFNPLIPPPGTKPEHWLVRLIDVMKHAFFLGEGVEYLLREAMDWAYDKKGVFEGSKDYPVFSQVEAFVTKRFVKGRMSLWQASAIRALAHLTYRRGLGTVVDVPDQVNPDDLLSGNVVLELDALSDVDKLFFTESLLLWIYEYRKNDGKREKFKHAIIIEEGHHILSAAKEKHEGQETIMETILRQIREFGESVIVIDQEPSKLSDSIKANTYCKITFNLGNGKDIEDITTCMQLTEEQKEYIGMLPVGQGIASLSGRVLVPLHLSFPLVPVKKGLVKDSDL
jgi:hypothetical protein